MPLQPGARLGPYDILEPLGAGGMGAVYKARDTRLDRLVAIKRSATEFSDRFEREARAVAALNHPNICQLYDVGPDYLVMEFLDGRPLAPVEGARKVLDLAVQIADGMAAAHAAGIVHRDLKPDNIFVTAGGRVKILDFGIAKAIGDEAGDQQTRASLTGAGTAIGTVHYMSPEQARGLTTIGPQSDQFSFGLILYELVTGQKAFARDSSAETLTAIIREDAAPLPPMVPAPLRWIVERLLAKDPAERYDSSRDLFRELKQLRDRLTDTTAPVSGMTAAAGPAAGPRSRTRRWLVVVALLAVAGAASALTWALVPRGRTGEVDLAAYRFTPISLEAPTEREPVWSPDGRSLAYLASIDGVPQLMIREVGAATAVQLTQGRVPSHAPFWASDGSRVYFLRPGSGLWSVSAVGGEPEVVIEGATSAALHPRDGRFVIARGGRLWMVDPASGASGNDPQPFGQPPFEGTADVRAFSPDGAKLAVVKDGAVWVLAYPGGAARQVATANAMGGLSWMPDGRRIVVSPVQVSDSNRWPGIEVVDTDTLVSRTILASSFGLLYPSVSPDGTRLAFVTGDSRWKLVEVTLADGRVRELGTGGRQSLFPSLSPDGTRLAFADGLEPIIREMALSPSSEVLGRTIATVTEGGTTFLNHVDWSPDGTRVLFLANIPSGGRLMVAPAGGGRALAVDPATVAPPGGVWSPDGTQIAYRRQVGNEQQIVAMRVGTSAAPVVVKRWSVQDPPDRLRTPHAWSPDGRWILTGAGSTLFLMSADGTNERQLSQIGSQSWRARAIFSRDGREVLTLSRDQSASGRPWRLFAVDVASGAERVVTTVDFPKTTDAVSGLTISADGKRLYTSFADWPFDIWMLEGFR
jgi:Tol biopolymer transport system component/predicted Ser/Thr protein kinase